MAKLSFLATPEGRLRLLSTALLAPLALFVVYLGGPAFAAVAALITGAALYEWLQLVDAGVPKDSLYAIGIVFLVVLLLAAFGFPFLAFLIIILATVALYMRRKQQDVAKALWFSFGLPYLAGAGLALIYLRAEPQMGGAAIAYLVAVVWGTDIGGYLAGHLIGGPKLAPRISPGKTWAGAIGGLVLAMFLAAWVLMFTGAASFGGGLMVAAVMSVVSQAGDLFKSVFKRRAGVKHSGTIIPGHGGVLDRIDGLIAASIFFALMHAAVGRGWIW